MDILTDIAVSLASGAVAAWLFLYGWKRQNAEQWPTLLHDEHRYDTMLGDGVWRCGDCGKVKDE